MFRVENVTVHLLGHVVHVAPPDPVIGDLPLTAQENEQWSTGHIVLAIGEVPHLPSVRVGLIEMVKLLGDGLGEE